MEYPNRKLPPGIPPSRPTEVPTVGEAVQDLANQVKTSSGPLSPNSACLSPRSESAQMPPGSRPNKKKTKGSHSLCLSPMRTVPESFTIGSPSVARESQNAHAEKDIEGILYQSRILSPRPSNQSKRVKWPDVDAPEDSTQKAEEPKTRARGAMQDLVESFAAFGVCCGPVDTPATPIEMPQSPLVTIYEVERKSALSMGKLRVKTDLPMVRETLGSPTSTDPIMSFRERKLSNENDGLDIYETSSNDSDIEARDDISTSDGEDWAPVTRPLLQPQETQEVPLQREIRNAALMRKDEMREHRHRQQQEAKLTSSTPRSKKKVQESILHDVPTPNRESILPNDEMREHRHRQQQEGKLSSSTPRSKKKVQESILHDVPTANRESILPNGPPPKRESVLRNGPPPKQDSSLQNGPPPMQESGLHNDIPPPKRESIVHSVPPAKRESILRHVPSPKRESIVHNVPPPKQESSSRHVPSPKLESIVHNVPPPKQESILHHVPTPKRGSIVHNIPPPEQESILHHVPSPKRESNVHYVPPPKRESTLHKVPPPKQESILHNVPRPKRASPRRHSSRTSSGSVKSGTTWTLPGDQKQKQSPRKPPSPRMKIRGFRCCKKQGRASQPHFAEINWAKGPPVSENPFENQEGRKVTFEIPAGQPGADSFDMASSRVESQADSGVSEVSRRSPQVRKVTRKKQARPGPEGRYEEGKYEPGPDIKEWEMEMKEALSSPSLSDVQSYDSDCVVDDRYERSQVAKQVQMPERSIGAMQGNRYRGKKRKGSKQAPIDVLLIL